MASFLVLIRHGQTTWSEQGKHTGKTDLPLTEEGEQRAVRLHEVLRRITFSRVLCSPSLRARKTCALSGLERQVEFVPQLREWNYGDYEGLTSLEIHTGRPGWNVFETGCPHGESVSQIRRRVDFVLKSLDDCHGPAALFSHGHFLRAVAARWLGQKIAFGRHLLLDTGALGILGYEKGTLENRCLHQWNVRPGSALPEIVADTYPAEEHAGFPTTATAPAL